MHYHSRFLLHQRLCTKLRKRPTSEKNDRQWMRTTIKFFKKIEKQKTQNQGNVKCRVVITVHLSHTFLCSLSMLHLTCVLQTYCTWGSIIDVNVRAYKVHTLHFYLKNGKSKLSVRSIGNLLHFIDKNKSRYLCWLCCQPPNSPTVNVWERSSVVWGRTLNVLKRVRKEAPQNFTF